MALRNHGGMQHLSQALPAPPASDAAGVLSIHPCAESDIEAIQAIYAHYVSTNLDTY